jgi:hypothetical protein
LSGTATGRTKLTDVVDWLKDWSREVPAKYRDTARLNVESVGGWEGEHHAELEIYYERPETDAEMNKREADYNDNIAAAAKA